MFQTKNKDVEKIPSSYFTLLPYLWVYASPAHFQVKGVAYEARDFIRYTALRKSRTYGEVPSYHDNAVIFLFTL